MNNTKNPINVAIKNSSSFRYKGSILGKATDADVDERSLKNAKVVIP